MKKPENKKKSILMYHSVGFPVLGDPGNGLYCVSKENFREQMQYITQVTKTQSHKVTEHSKFDEVHSPQSTVHGKLDAVVRRPSTVDCLITFDDGDVTNFTQAYPVLKELGLTAYFFILAGKIGSSGYMSWGQIKEMHDNGMIIGSHGMTHRIMPALSDKDIRYEINTSKEFIEGKLKTKIYYFSIPRGFYNKKILGMLKKAGYKGVFTSDSGRINDYEFGRIAIRSNWGIGQFKKVLERGPSVKDKLEGRLRKSAINLIGINNYDKLRMGLLKK
ncbi:MAG: polysaccharide deacetylase family protein [Candidatus Omnitrophota bacterium]|jgi:peptidoglycan/xylan/chitin deacetylase (PgdA/CDA1 family)|nr:MAG: polysaccharide deacetylase family protein [Candidatus Omnitrophota bacterium]